MGVWRGLVQCGALLRESETKMEREGTTCKAHSSSLWCGDAVACYGDWEPSPWVQ